jgi:hypothetical protein
MYKTRNNNYLIEDSGYHRFVDSQGFHIRWIDDQELGYLSKVLETTTDIPAIKDKPNPPSKKTVWQHIVPAQYPELSNNGGSYNHLYRVEERLNWDELSLNGYYLVTNHLYNSDYEDQGWNINKFDSESEAWDYIQKFKVPV